MALRSFDQSRAPLAQRVGTLIGESSSREFRLAVTHETIREQDIIAVDADLRRPDDPTRTETMRVWAKVQRIERINPLFPAEAGHELAAAGADLFDTVLSLSRELVTAVCTIIGAEPLHDGGGGQLDQVRYPPRPASNAYRPAASDIARILSGRLQAHPRSALDIGTLSSRPDVDVHVNAHAIVTRHLAILAMTGAGKSWTARRIIEQLAEKNYPIVIFDPHGDYTGLADIDTLAPRVRRYYARFPVFDEDDDAVAQVIETLGYELTDAMQALLPDVIRAARSFFVDDPSAMQERAGWLSGLLHRPQLARYGVNRDLWLIAALAEAGEMALRPDSAEVRRQLIQWGWSELGRYSQIDRRTLEGIKKRTYRAAKALQLMEQKSRKIAGEAGPLPLDRKELVRYGGISIVALAGYAADFQATLYSLIAESLFAQRVSGELDLPVLVLLEEAHTFAPSRASTLAEQRAVTLTRQIAQEGRKFGLGLILVSQRPARLDETTLSQCNSHIIMRMVNPDDQSHVRRAVESVGDDDVRLLPALDVGEALLSGQMIDIPVLVRVKPPLSKGEREEEDAFVALERAHKRRAARPTQSSYPRRQP